MRAWLVVAGVLMGACGTPPGGTVLSFSGSSVGAEGAVLRRQLARFEHEHLGVRVVQLPTPDAADQRHQLFVQWLNAGGAEPDVLQLDVIWTPEFAAAGWIAPLDRFAPDTRAFFAATIAADTWREHLYAVPWFADVGMLYWRTDLLPHAPSTQDELTAMAQQAMADGRVRYGLVWQGSRYEGLSCVFLELLGAFGGQILDEKSQQPQVDSPQAISALELMRAQLYRTRIVPEAALTWQEEQVRFAFQSGQTLFMRSWPYAAPLMQAPGSAVRGRFGVAPVPGTPSGASTAALGGAQLAINAHSAQPALAWSLVAFLTAPAQLLERAEVAGQYPPRPSLYDDPRLARALAPLDPHEVREIIEHAVPRPVTPVYTQLSEVLQARLHASLTRQIEPAPALHAAAEEMRVVLRAAGLLGGPAAHRSRYGRWLLGAIALGAAAALIWRLRRRPAEQRAIVDERGETRLAWLLMTPALGLIALIALFPLGWTAWESLHDHDLRMPWRGRTFIGLDNYVEALTRPRFWSALAHTTFFAVATVTLELLLGLALALGLERFGRLRGPLRATVLLPWALPTVVAALIWRFLAEGSAPLWATRPATAWVPVILADVWKTTPFVALLLLAGLQSIDASLYEAARVDGASALTQLRHVTLPLLKPALLVALIFRTLDALRVFDLIYVLTGGGPGTATEPIALYGWSALLANLRFGYGAALGMMLFAITFGLALVYIRLLGGDLTRART